MLKITLYFAFFLYQNSVKKYDVNGAKESNKISVKQEFQIL